ncbi:P-loop containing nucleoside triphosphate hydrolase protein [Mycena vitilis]|nr:P-loop containing nucleoside triphosphate hydrolase protein [Mycena vitilis]
MTIVKPSSGATSVVAYASAAAGFLQEIAKSATNVPFLGVVAGVSILILDTVESVRRNKDKCMHMVERIYEILRGLINLCGDAESLLSPAMLQAIADFAETLQLIQSYVSAQMEARTIKRFFKAADNIVQSDQCNAGLDRALVRFKVHTQLTSMKTVQEMEADNEVLHRQVMALIQSTADTYSSANSVWPSQQASADSIAAHADADLPSSSSLFLLFPPRPKLFHGRQDEVDNIVAMLTAQDPPRVAILGSGGIGKTALALSACHHPDVQAKFVHRYFNSCESAFSRADIVSALAAQLDISESAQTLKDVLQQLSSRVEPTLLVLDNLETTWEPSISRAGVEELLTHLADISHVALLVTMRGAERPSKVRWTRPFLPPLEPLSREAAIQTLADIVDDDDDATSSQIHEVLDFTDNMPLAVTLLGAIISFEGYAQTIERWKLENTALLSEGYAKDSNLDKSIAMSLSSPRMTSSPGARDLLSVLCLLPSGISDSDFAMLGLPITDLGRAKATLLRTSLASSEDGRLKALSPIRQYIQRTCPPTPALVQPLLQFLRELVNIWSSFRQLPSGDLVPRLKANVGNFRSLFVYAATMEQTRQELIQTGLALLKFSHFLSDTSSASDDMFRMIPDIIERAGDDDLHGRYLLQRFIRHYDYDIEDAEALSEKAIQHFEKAGNRTGVGVSIPK